MKFSPTIIAATALVACAATATAFTLGPSNSVSSSSRSQSSSKPAASSTQLKMAADETVKAAIESNDVVVFSKSYCPYCAATKSLFSEMGVQPKIFELNEIGDDGPEMQMALFKMTGQRTVPNVFVKGQHIGGNDDTQAAAKSGKLKEMLSS